MKKPREGNDMRLNFNDDKTLDEITGNGKYHLEQMDKDHWWLLLDDGTHTVHVNFYIKKKKIIANYEFDQQSV